MSDSETPRTNALNMLAAAKEKEKAPPKRG